MATVAIATVGTKINTCTAKASNDQDMPGGRGMLKRKFWFHLL